MHTRENLLSHEMYLMGVCVRFSFYLIIHTDGFQDEEQIFSSFSLSFPGISTKRLIKTWQHTVLYVDECTWKPAGNNLLCRIPVNGSACTSGILHGLQWGVWLAMTFPCLSCINPKHLTHEDWWTHLFAWRTAIVQVIISRFISIFQGMQF